MAARAGSSKAKPAASRGAGAKPVVGSAAAAEAEARHVHARLAQAFAVADSLDGGTVAAHEVGALLWRTGVVTAAAELAALRPPASDAAKRVGFEQALVGMSMSMSMNMGMGMGMGMGVGMGMGMGVGIGVGMHRVCSLSPL